MTEIKSPYQNYYLGKELRQFITDLARLQHRSESWMVRQLIREALHARKLTYTGPEVCSRDHPDDLNAL